MGRPCQGWGAAARHPVLPNRVLSSPLNCSSIGAACSLYLPPPGAAAARPLCGACAPGSWPPDSGFRSRIQRTQRVKSSWEQREESVTRLAYRELPGPCTPGQDLGAGMVYAAARRVGWEWPAWSDGKPPPCSVSRQTDRAKFKPRVALAIFRFLGRNRPPPAAPRARLRTRTRAHAGPRARAQGVFFTRARAPTRTRAFIILYIRGNRSLTLTPSPQHAPHTAVHGLVVPRRPAVLQHHPAAGQPPPIQ